MSWLIYPGAIVTLLGLAGLGYCIKTAMGLRTANLDDDQMTAQLQRLVPINLGSVCVAALGLMMVVIGVLL
ncbi:hypothetical protein [Amylibacter sp. IMCC11727]|uniref:hypothetical protein n=1 Tax=Amylibacter sp. IMCC11727 TaxID=3039851 RepID=UPI00244E0623|nr:hypothetical protein [Amylibacter sp. IMCC11727]WGI21265.1 hypothetical protein QBD29_14260 [Amylibacter sp. IMCC11727]